MPRRWLVKTEPSKYPFAALLREGRTTWSGVKNGLARRHLRAMRPGDLVLVYHTEDERAVVGLARVASDPGPDPTLPDAASVAVDLVPVAAAKTPVPLAAVKASAACRDLALVRHPRLSVQPVTETAWQALWAAAGW